MLVWNDLEADEKIKIYDKGVKIGSSEGVYDLLVSYRSGDMWAPQLNRWKRFTGAGLLCRLHSTGEQPFNDGEPGCGWCVCLKPRPSRSNRKVLWFIYEPFEFVADDVKLGENVRLSKFINLYGCEIGDETKIGAFVEIQKNAKVGSRCKISSHTFICEGVTIEDNVFIGHGVMFTNDSYPRATTASGELQTEADWKVDRP